MARDERPPLVTTPWKTLSERRGSVVISRGTGLAGVALWIVYAYVPVTKKYTRRAIDTA